MMEDQENHIQIDPKIIVALISALVSVVSAAIPILSDTERNFFLVAFAFLLALILMGVCVYILFRKRLYVAIAALLLLSGSVLSSFFAQQVVKPPEALSYLDTTVSVYAGNGEREFRDGAFEDCSFVIPACMSAYQDKLYVTDSDRIRCLENGVVTTEPFPSSHYNARLIRNLEADLYVLAENRQMESGKYYNFFIRIRNGESEVVSEKFEVGAFSASVSDFAFSKSGVLWFIRLYDVPGTASATLQKLSYDRDADRYGPPEWVMDFHYEADDMKDARMTFDADDNLYISVPGQGVILRQGRDEPECTLFAGEDGNHTFNDQAPFTFSYPTALLPENGALYVLDNGVVRRLRIDGNRAVSCETLAGVTPEVLNSGKKNVRGVGVGESVAGTEFAFPADVTASLALDRRGRLLLSDPENGFLYQIWEN